MDIMGADFYNVLKMVHDRLKCNAVPIQLPIGAEETFRGIVDLVKMFFLARAGSLCSSEWVQKQVVAAEVMVIPRSCSCAIQSIWAVPSWVSPILCVLPV